MQASDLRAWRRPFALLDRCGGWSADLSLRLFLAWEFFESGWEKWNGENWFGDIQSAFPFPFDRLPAAFNWELSLWAELLGALFLLLGLGTRLTALVLIVVHRGGAPPYTGRRSGRAWRNWPAATRSPTTASAISSSRRSTWRRCCRCCWRERGS